MAHKKTVLKIVQLTSESVSVFFMIENKYQLRFPGIEFHYPLTGDVGWLYHPRLKLSFFFKKYIILYFVFFSTFLLTSVIYDFVITDHMNTVRF